MITNLEEISESLNIIDVIQMDQPLVLRGKDYQGLCPFHEEKTPSFSVSEEKQVFHCFGCGESGNVFMYWQKKTGLDFTDCVKDLSDKFNIQVEESKTEKDNKYKDRNEYGKSLLSAPVINYGKRRGLSQETLDFFGIGIGTKDYYPKLKGRFIIPIKDEKNNLVGFNGRTITNQKPKYLLTSFDKNKVVFNLNNAYSYLKKQDEVYIVEGCLDVVKCYEKGVYNVVAIMGASISLAQLNLILKYTSNIILALDADKAGIKATAKFLEKVKDEIYSGLINCSVLQLPKSIKDLDEFFTKFDPDDFYSLSKKEWIEWSFNFILNNQKNPMPKLITLLQRLDSFRFAKYLDLVAITIDKENSEIVKKKIKKMLNKPITEGVKIEVTDEEKRTQIPLDAKDLFTNPDKIRALLEKEKKQFKLITQ